MNSQYHLNEISSYKTKKITVKKKYIYKWRLPLL